MAQHRAHLRRLNIACGVAAILTLCTPLAACTISVPDVSVQPTAEATTSASAATASASTGTVTASATATATSIPRQASVIAVSSSIVTVGSNTTGTASASCASGNPMLGGGFIVRLSGNNGIPPADSYPSGASVWTVDVTTQAGAVQLTAIVVCLQANFHISTQMAQVSNGGPDTTVSCPSGSVLTGGGFRSGGGTNVASQPNGNGWKISTAAPFGGSATPTAYVICVTQGLTAAATQSQSKTVTNGTVDSNGASCPAGQLPVGGGYNGYQPASDTYWNVFLNSPETGQGSVSTGWMAQVHNGQFGTPSFTVYSVCATF